MCIGTFRSPAGAEISNDKQVGQKSASPKACKLLVSVVLATTDPNLLNCGSSKAASGTCYCCRLAVQGLGVRGSEHRSIKYFVGDKPLVSFELADLFYPLLCLMYLG